MTLIGTVAMIATTVERVRVMIVKIVTVMGTVKKLGSMKVMVKKTIMSIMKVNSSSPLIEVEAKQDDAQSGEGKGSRGTIVSHATLFGSEQARIQVATYNTRVGLAKRHWD